MRLAAKLPEDDSGSKLMRFEGIRGQRHTEIWLDVPKEMREHESVAYKEIGGRRGTQLWIDAESPVHPR